MISWENLKGFVKLEVNLVFPLAGVSGTKEHGPQNRDLVIQDRGKKIGEMALLHSISNC